MSLFLSQDIKEFPQRGGANGSIRFYPEINHGANAGLFGPRRSMNVCIFYVKMTPTHAQVGDDSDKLLIHPGRSGECCEAAAKHC
jgi:hypothetical protein